MIKIRNKRIALLLVLAMLATMFVGVGTASAASGENGVLKITKSVNTNIAEDDSDNLGYVKVAVDADEAVDGIIYVEMTLPDDVEFDTDDAQYATATAADDDGIDCTDTTFTINSSYAAFPGPDTAVDFEMLLDAVYVPNVIVDSSAADEINVDVIVNYVDNDFNEIDTFENTLLLASKADQNTTIIAASPKSVSMGDDKKIAKITLDEEIAGSLELGSVVVFELPDGFEWGPVDNDNDDYDFVETDGTYELTADVINGPDFDIDEYDDSQLIVVITNESNLADKFRFVAFITVFPDAPDGDVVVEAYDGDADADSNVDSTEITVAVVGGADVTVTAEDTSDTAGDIYRASQGDETVDETDFDGANTELWEITLETSGTFQDGDDLLLTLPKGVEFMEDTVDPDNLTIDGFINHGTYDNNKSLWLTVEEDTANDLVITGLEVGVTPEAALGDLVVTLEGDVVDATVVAQKIVDRVTASATTANIKIGLNQVAGVVTLVENKDKALVDGDQFYVKTSNGVNFSTKFKAWMNGEDELDVTKVSDNTYYIEIDESKGSDKDTITLDGIKVDVDNRFLTGSELKMSIGGLVGTAADDLNQLNGADGGQFEAEADDVMYTVALGTIGSASATKVVFTIGQNSYVKDGVTFAMDVAPFTMNNRTMIPVRFLANALGVPDQNIFWDQLTQTVTLVKEDNVVQLKLGSTTRLINAMADTMDVAPVAQNNRIFLPARFVAEAFEAIVGWDAAAPNQVTININ